MPKKLEAKKWTERLERAKKVRERWRERFRIPLCYSYWEGAQRPSTANEDEWITINMIYSSLMAELPGLYSTDPYFYVKLKKSYAIDPGAIAEYDAKAQVRQSFLNYLKGEIDLKEKVRLSIFDTFFQYGICKVYYHADMVENPDAGRPLTFEDTDLPLLGEGEQPLLEPDYLPSNEAYCVSRIHPDDFLVDEDAGPLDESVSWKAHRVKRSLDEAKSDKKYRSAARKILKATEISGDSVEQEREQRKKGGLLTNDNGKEPEICVIWEIYDLKNKQRIVVAEGCPEYLVEPEDLPPGIDRDPFVDLRFTLRDDSWYPLPPVSQWLDSQREYCELRSKVLAHRKRFSRKYEAYAPALDDPEMDLAKLVNGDDGTIILKNQPVPVITPIQDAPLDQTNHVEFGYLRQDFLDLAAGANQRGATAGIDSATEAGIIERRMELREGDRRSVCVDFMQRIGRKLDQIVQAHITADQAIRVSGPMGEAWELIRTSDYDSINGEYEYSIDIGQVTPQLPEIERAQLMGALQVLASAPHLMTSPALLKVIFKDLFGLNNQLVIQELMNVAQQMIAAQAAQNAPPGQPGSVAGVNGENPISALLGAAGGINNVRGGNMSGAGGNA